MKFKLLSGSHKMDGQEFKTGDIIETHYELDKMFLNKFQAVFEQPPTPEPVTIVPTAPVPVTPTPIVPTPVIPAVDPAPTAPPKPKRKVVLD